MKMPFLNPTELMTFFHGIMHGHGVSHGDQVNFPTMEQRMKAAGTLLSLLEKQGNADETGLTLHLTEDQINAMRENLRKKWNETKYALKKQVASEEKNPPVAR